MSRHSSGGKYVLHAPCWNLSLCSACGELLLHVPRVRVCLFVRGVAYTCPVLELVSSFGGAGVSFTHPSSKLSRRSAGGEFVLYARLSILSGRSAHLQGLLHNPRWNVSARSADRKSYVTDFEISLAEC